MQKIKTDTQLYQLQLVRENKLRHVRPESQGRDSHAKKNQAEEQSQQLVQRPYSRKELGKFKRQKTSHKVRSVKGKGAKYWVRPEKPVPVGKMCGFRHNCDGKSIILTKSLNFFWPSIFLSAEWGSGRLYFIKVC